MQTAGAFGQIGQRFSGRFFIPENVEAFGWRVPAGWRRYYSAKNHSDFLHLFPQLAGEIARGGKAKTSREPSERFAVFRNGVGLLLRFDL